MGTLDHYLATERDRTAAVNEAVRYVAACQRRRDRRWLRNLVLLLGV